MVPGRRRWQSGQVPALPPKVACLVGKAARIWRVDDEGSSGDRSKP